MTFAAESLRRDLTSSRELLLAAVAGVTEEQFKLRPPRSTKPIEAGETPLGQANWCLAEVLAHLLQQERLRAERIELALTQDGVAITPSAPEVHYESARAGRAVPVPQLIHGLLASRRDIERLLGQGASLEAGLQRSTIHPQLGRQTVEWILREKVIAHEEEHVTQIEAIKAALRNQPVA